GSISNANSESDHQSPDPGMMMMPQHDEDSGGNSGKTSSTSPLRAGDAGKIPAGELRRGDADRALIQNGGGGGGGGGKRRLQLLQTPSSAQKHKNWDKLVVKEAKKVSKNIDRALKELKREYKQTHRLLLLGG
ncbi:hypothetical protein M9458_047563, partial [Cirrhinus mrigala]